MPAVNLAYKPFLYFPFYALPLRLQTIVIFLFRMNRTDFPILQDTVYGRPLVYLDNAATTQRPAQMLTAMTDAYLHRNANIHRGVHHLSQVATAAHEQARQKVADFFHARSAKEILFTRGTTDSLNLLAFSFGEAFVGEDDEIIVSHRSSHRVLALSP